MRKYVLTLLLLTAVTAVMAQKKSVINLIRSESIQRGKINGVEVLKVYAGTFQQDYSTLSSDSAYFHPAQNTFDAFGHVVITQGDTLHVYSDKLNYNGNTKVAILTQNVSMVDKDATLTTDYLTYNTATKIATYTGGGKLVNKDNTLTSKNGYYFANSRDSYFRYDVVLLSPDAITNTDTLRYNSASKIAYFLGPTRIYGKKSGKDNDTLYTENGNYNTVTEQAFFGKKNLYSQGSKTLKGDSMFYDRKNGYGRVVNHITFNDNEQKMTLKGDLGTFYKSDERTVVTQNAYGVIVTEEKDTTKDDLVASKPPSKPVNGKKATADTAKISQQGKATTTGKENKPGNKSKAPANTIPLKELPKQKQDTLAGKKGDKSAAKNKLSDSILLKKDTAKIKHDSVYMTADTLETRMLTYKQLKDIQEKIRLANIKDTTVRAPSIVYKKPVKYIELSAPGWVQDSTYLHRNMFGKVKPKTDTVAKKTSTNNKSDKNAAATTTKKLSKQDSLKQAKKVDSVYLSRKVELSDTSRIRVLSAFHHVKLFKSDLQGKSDSAFYSTSDSIIRLYVKPMLWAQSSQLSGDTINLQLKNKKFDNLEIYLNAFAVNIEKGDSTHFNQSAGKKMRGFFHDDKLDRLFVDGNAETIYFSRDSGKISGMQRSLSSRMRLNFKDGKVSDLVFMDKPEHRYGPLVKFSEEDKILKGFIWKPKDRPVSKEAIIPSLGKNGITANAGNKGKPPATGKSASNKPPGVKTTTTKNATAGKPGNIKAPAPVKSASDTAKATKDTTRNSAPQKSADTTNRKKDSTVVVKPVQEK